MLELRAFIFQASYHFLEENKNGDFDKNLLAATTTTDRVKSRIGRG
jgi:hypothetical protein